MISRASCSGVFSFAESTGEVISSATGTISGSRRLSASFFMTSRSEKTPTTLSSPSTTATAPTPFLSIMRMESATEACRCTVAGWPSHIARTLIASLPETPIMRPVSRAPQVLFAFADDGFRLDLNQHLGIDQRGDPDHAGRRTDVAKDFAMSASHRAGMCGDVDHVHSGADHVFHRRSGFRKRALDILQSLHRLLVG